MYTNQNCTVGVITAKHFRLTRTTEFDDAYKDKTISHLNNKIWTTNVGF